MATIVKNVGTATGSAGTGTVTAAASTSVIGVGTLFTTEMKDGSGYALTMSVSGTLYNVASITDDTHLTLTTSATFTAAAYTRGSRNYSTIAAFAAALPANLVTDGNSYEGDLYNDSEFAENTSITGHTTDSTHFITLTTGAGQSFRNDAGAATNPLRYDQTKGVGVKGSGYNATLNTFGDIYTVVSKIQFTNTPNGFQICLSVAATVAVDSCIVDGRVSGGNLRLGSGGGLFTNCVYIGGTGSVSGFFIGGAKFANCTFVTPTGLSATNNLFVDTYSSGTMVNCAVFGFTSISTNGHITCTTCMTDIASPPAGFTGGKTYANQFQNTGTTLANRDFRAKAGADLLDAGTTDTTDIPSAIDIIGTSRPQGSAWDIGCWELVSSGGSPGGNSTQFFMLMGLGR